MLLLLLGRLADWQALSLAAPQPAAAAPQPPPPCVPVPPSARQAIIARLRRRDLYKYVTDALIPLVSRLACLPLLPMQLSLTAAAAASLAWPGLRQPPSQGRPPHHSAAATAAPKSQQEVMERGQWAAPTAQDIVNSYQGSDVHLSADDIILQVGLGSCRQSWAAVDPAVGSPAAPVPSHCSLFTPDSFTS